MGAIKILKTYCSINLLMLMLSLGFTIQSIYAGVEHFTNKIEGCELNAGAVMLLEDDKYPIMQLNPTSWQNEFQIKGVSEGRIILKLDPSKKVNYGAIFTVDALVNVSYYTQSLALNTFTTTLSFTYDPNSNSLSTDKNIHRFYDVHSMVVTLGLAENI
jgi:hypothetical protein